MNLELYGLNIQLGILWLYIHKTYLYSNHGFLFNNSLENKKNEKIKGDDMSNLKIKRTAAIIVMRKEEKTSGNAYDSHSQGNIPALHVFKTV